MDAASLAAIGDFVSPAAVPATLNRGLLWGTFYDMTRDAELSATRYLHLAREKLPTDGNPTILRTVLSRRVTVRLVRRTDARRAAPRALTARAVPPGPCSAASIATRPPLACCCPPPCTLTRRRHGSRPQLRPWPLLRRTTRAWCGQASWFVQALSTTSLQ